MTEQLLTDFLLRYRRLARAFAGELKYCAGARERKYTWIDEGVVNDDIGLRQTRHGIERQQSRISGAGAHEPHLSRCELRVCAAQYGERVSG